MFDQFEKMWKRNRPEKNHDMHTSQVGTQCLCSPSEIASSLDLGRIRIGFCQKQQGSRGTRPLLGEVPTMADQHHAIRRVSQQATLTRLIPVSEQHSGSWFSPDKKEAKF